MNATGGTLALNVDVCGSCLRGYSHGIEPDRHPRLMDHLQAKGLSIKLTGVGLLDIGDEPTDFIGVRNSCGATREIIVSPDVLCCDRARAECL
jgi:hypothetical protein